MALKLYSDSDIQDIADAIRGKNGLSTTYKVSQMAAAITAIPTGGASHEDELLNGTLSGAYENANVTSVRSYTFNGFTGLTSVSLPNITATATSMFNGCTSLASVSLPKVTSISGTDVFKNASALNSLYLPKVTSCAANSFRDCKVKILVFPAVASSGTNFVNQNTTVKTVDFGTSYATMGDYTFNGSTAVDTLILRRTSRVALSNVRALASTKFKSGGTGGTIYIPKALYDHLGDGSSSDYKALTNWATVDGYGTITWAKIEGSAYETAYADGTPIPS